MVPLVRRGSAPQLGIPDPERTGIPKEPEDDLDDRRWAGITVIGTLIFCCVAPLSAQQRFAAYPATEMGGNYMHNFYLPRR